MKEKEVLIEIIGTYDYIDDEEPDVIELFTTGTYKKEGDDYVITYDETEVTGFVGSTTTLEVKKGIITMTRTGEEANAHLVIQHGVRHQCQYDTGFGDMVIGVNGQLIKSSLGINGGDLHFKYSMDIDSAFASENEMNIKVSNKS